MAGLTLFTGNRLERLAERLADRLRQEPLPPLTREVVVVQSRGMERWLNLAIADRNSVCANIDFVFPKHFVAGLFRRLADSPDPSLFSIDTLTWVVAKVLPTLVDTAPFAALKRYLEGDHDGLKLFQLSEQIAAVMDRYLVLRPDMILAWETGRSAAADISADEKWQAVLWRRVLDELPDNIRRLHPAALKQRLFEEAASLTGLPERLSIFGISTLAPYYVDLLPVLSRRISVDIYYLNPCREFWEYAFSEKEILGFESRGITEEAHYLDRGNRLLASMGVAGREFFSLLLNAAGDAGEDLFADPGRENLLSAVQSDILNLIDAADQPPAVLAGEDSTIRVHSCHTPMREVEVLYDTLLFLLDRQDGLQPRDIVVMMPDVAVYAPLIQAVFDSPEEAARRIPYSIADTGITAVNTAAAAFLAVLHLDDSRYRTTAVLDLLENDMIRRRFDLTAGDIERLRNWIEESGIRWGVDKDYRTGLGLPGFHENTWAFGLDRLLLGHALPASGAEPLFAGILPCGEAEGAQARLLGRFVNFMRTLFAYGKQLRQERPVEAWRLLLNRLLTDFFAAGDEAGQRDLLEIRERLSEQAFSGGADLCGHTAAVSPAVIRYCLGKKLAAASRGSGFLSAGVTFGTLLPMRSIPFKVVCLLGMNDADYPRVSRQPGFDLTATSRRLCDYSRRNEDRYLFLESLLSARQAFIISYVGQDIRDNHVIPPSALVSELLDYIQAGFTTVDGRNPLEKIVVRHPLQPFSPRYFNGSENLFSYSDRHCRAARASLTMSDETSDLFRESLPPAEEDDWSRISLEHLAGFFKNPAAFLLKNRLQVDLSGPASIQPSDREPMEPDSLDQYRIGQDLTDGFLEGRDPDTARMMLTASGRLPHGTPGEIEWLRHHQRAADFAATVRLLQDGEILPPLGVMLRPAADRNITLVGTLSSLYPAGQVFYRYARLKGKDIVRAWIFHLALNAAESAPDNRATLMAGRDGIIRLAPLDKDTAVAGLGNLIDLFDRGLRRPLPFFPESALVFAEQIAAGKESAKALQAAWKKWMTDWKGVPGEYDDGHVRRCFDPNTPAGEDFQKIALAVFQPVLAALADDPPAGGKTS